MRVLIASRWAACASLLLTACSNPSSLGLSGGGLGASDTSNNTAALASTGKAPDSKESAVSFNPLALPETKAPGGREVIKNPTLQDVLAKGNLPEFSLGNANAPVTVIKYASLTCPYCKQFHQTQFPRVKRELIDTGKIRFIIREFPIGRSSGNATIALRCAPMGKYLALYGKYLDQQSSWVSQEVRTNKIFAVAQQVGMTRSQFDACMKNQGMINDLQWVKDRGRKLGVIGTPNFFIQNKLFKKQLTFEEIEQEVAKATRAPAVAGAN